MDSKSSTNKRTLPKTVEVGRIGRPHGLRGEVTVEVSTSVPGRFDPGSALLLVAPGGRPRSVEVASSRPHKGMVLLRLAGHDGRDAAEALRGCTLEVPRSAVPPVEEGEYYYYELVGCRCVDEELGDLGEVFEVREDGGGHLLMVDDGERKIPVPFVKAFLQRVDVDAGEIRLRLPAGLIETCASRS